jgi:hypothetical protein
MVSALDQITALVMASQLEKTVPCSSVMARIIVAAMDTAMQLICVTAILTTLEQPVNAVIHFFHPAHLVCPAHHANMEHVTWMVLSRWLPTLVAIETMLMYPI